MFESILIPFGTILVAELFDKSQLSILLLATKTRNYFQLLLGVFLAFLIVDGLAVLLGSVLTTLIPLLWVRIISGALFIGFGIKTLRDHQEGKVQIGKIHNVFFTSFSFIFFSEWGDKTQIVSALFATRYNSFAVITGVMLALMTLAIVTILLSRLLKSYVKPGLISQIAGIVFIVLGISFFFIN